MIKRTSAGYRKLTENLQDNSFTGSNGIDITKAPTSRETVVDMTNLEVDNDGGLRLRKPLVLKLNYPVIIGKSSIIKVISLYDNESKLIICKEDSNYYLYCYSNSELIPITFYDNDTKNTIPMITGNLINNTKWEDIDNVNTFDSTIITGVAVDLTQFSNYYDSNIIEESDAKNAYRYFRVELEDSKCNIYYINPEINILNSQNTIPLNPNMSLDYAYAIRDNYNSQTVSCEGILAYALCEKDNLGKFNPTTKALSGAFSVKVLTESNKNISYKIISTLDKNYSNVIYLKAFCNVKAKSNTKLLCIWEKTYDGVEWQEVNSFYSGISSSDIIEVSIKDKTLETINGSVNIYETKRFRELNMNNENDLVSARPDCLKIDDIDDATYKFSIYSYQEYDLSTAIKCTQFSVNNTNFTSTLSNSDDISRLYQKQLKYGDYYSRTISLSLKAEEYDAYKNAKFSVTAMCKEYLYQNESYVISETTKSLGDNLSINSNGVLELSSLNIATNVTLKSFWKNYATKIIVRADDVPVFIIGFIEHYYIDLTEKTEIDDLDYIPLEITGEFNGTFGGNVTPYHFQNTHTLYSEVKVLNTSRDIDIIYNLPSLSTLSTKVDKNTLYYYTKNINKNCKVKIDWDYLYKQLSGNDQHQQGELSYTAFKNTFLTKGESTDCVIAISTPNVGQSYYVINADESRNDYIYENGFNKIYNGGTSSYGYINPTQAYTVEGEYVYTDEDIVYVLKSDDDLISYITEINTDLKYGGSVVGENLEPNTINYTFDNLPTVEEVSILASNLVNIDSQEYSLNIANKTEVLYNEYGSSVVGEKLYYKKAIYTYGLEQFKNNVFPSDTGSFITSLFNVIELDVTDGSAINVLIPWRDYLIAASDKSIYLITKVDTSYTTKTINTFIGIPHKDRKTCKAILNGLIFKSGTKLYTLQPNLYSSDETILNIKEISKPIENYIINTDYDTFAFTNEKAYFLFIPSSKETTCLMYEYARNIWQKYTYPVCLIDYNLYSIDNITLIDDKGKEYYFNKELFEIPNSLTPDVLNNIPYADYINVTLDDMEDFGTTDLKDKYIPISFNLNSGNKTFDIVNTKQFVETKIILATQSEQDIMPMQLNILIDGSPYPIHIDASTDAPFWKTNIWNRGSLSTLFISEKTINEKVLKQGIFRYSGQGKTILHLLQGSSIYNFKLYAFHYRFKNLTNKK